MIPIDSALAHSLRNRYVLERELGRGGMATVYLAHDLKHGRSIALKVLHAELTHVVGPERFLREIRLTAQLQHPNILPVFDSGDADGLLYYTMPYIRGESLRQRLAQERQLSVEEALGVAGHVLAALHHAHEHGIIHRDIKPENLLLSNEGAMVADFGIAKAISVASSERLTETGLSLGTPHYMSPEQASGEPGLDGRSDLYSVGCVLYEMLAGQPPFTGPTAQAILARHAVDPVPSLRTVRATVPAGIERAVAKALAKVPADRFRDAAHFSQALATHDGAPWPEHTRRTRPRVLATAAIAATIAAIGVAALALQLRRDRTQPSTPVDSRIVAVLPFRASGADPVLQYLREGMVDLLAIKLTGEGGPRAADPRAVLSAWRRAGGSPTHDLSPDAALGIARGLGAGRLIDGGIVGTARHLTLTASVLQVSNGRARDRATVEGSPDSVPALVDRLTAELLAGEAGQRELASLTALPTLRAYFEGERAYRLGRWNEALRAFDQALRSDSTFAPAAMGLHESGFWADASSAPESFRGRALELAWANRARLSARDRAVLEAQTGPNYPDGSTAAEGLAARERAVAAVPDSPELWYFLGDQYFHFGPLLGVDSSLSRAAAAFRRSLALDSASAVFASYAEPLHHLIQIAAVDGDTATLRRLVTTALSADSATDNAGYYRWILAVTSGDTAAARSVRSQFPQMSRGSLLGIALISQELGFGWHDAQRALDAIRAQSPTSAHLEENSSIAHGLALNRGRPAEALIALQRMPEREPREHLHWRVLDALYWDGDSAAGAEAARELRHDAEGPPATSDEDREAQWRDLCVLQQWRLAHGDSAGARAIIARRLSVASKSICALVLEAWLATIGKQSDAIPLLDGLDSLLLRGVGDSRTLPPNLIAARLREAAGDSRGALAAIRRRVYGCCARWFLSTSLREEGRLAALSGDTIGAIKAYQHYLALRSDPEPGLKPEVERVRTELAALLKEPRR